MSEHTATPWATDGSYVVAKNGPTIADCFKSPSLDKDMKRANAAFIVLACNNFDRLTRENAAMREALDNNRRLLIMIHELGSAYVGLLGNVASGITTADWDNEGLTKLITEQITDNRAAFALLKEPPNA